jgi:hypothetical protein
LAQNKQAASQQQPEKVEPQKSESVQAFKEFEKTTDMLLKAMEGVKENSEFNFKNIEKALSTLFAGKEQLKEKLEAIETDFNEKLEAVKIQPVADPLSAKMDDANSRIHTFITSSSVWMYLAVIVIAIFLPFTVMGLLKYIAIPMDWWLPMIAVPMMCVAIACIWDMAIFFFAINGRESMALFGSVVQAAFFAAKFDLMATIISDAFGSDGHYWQGLIVKILASIYSPFLVASITKLCVESLKKSK